MSNVDSSVDVALAPHICDSHSSTSTSSEEIGYSAISLTITLAKLRLK